MSYIIKKLKTDYTKLSERVIKPFMCVSTTYLYEIRFSTYVYTLNKYRYLLRVESNLCIYLSNIDLNINTGFGIKT